MSACPTRRPAQAVSPLSAQAVCDVRLACCVISCSFAFMPPNRPVGFTFSMTVHPTGAKAGRAHEGSGRLACRRRWRLLPTAAAAALSARAATAAPATPAAAWAPPRQAAPAPLPPEVYDSWH